MAMSRKDYEAVAQVINKEFRHVRMVEYGDALGGALFSIRQIVDGLARTFTEDNPRFDEGLFRTACYKLDS